MWPGSPFGSFADVMVEDAAGLRTLVAPTPQIAEFVADTYSFDRTLIEPIRLGVGADEWSVVAPSVTVRLRTGRRTLVGQLLVTLPPMLRLSLYRFALPAAGRGAPRSIRWCGAPVRVCAHTAAPERSAASGTARWTSTSSCRRSHRGRAATSARSPRWIRRCASDSAPHHASLRWCG